MKRIFHTGHFYLHPARQYPALYRRDGRIDCMAPARERDARWRRFGTRYRPGRHPAGALRHIPPHLCRQWRCGGAEGRAFPCPVRRPIRSFMPRTVYGVATPCGRCRISRAPAVKTMHGCRNPATVHSLRSMIGVVSAPLSSFDRLAPAFEKLGLAAADKVHDFGQAVREFLEILLV